MAHKKRTWNWDEVSLIMSEAFNLGKQVVRNADYYSLSDPLGEMKDKVLNDKISKPRASNKPTKAIKPKRTKDTFIDGAGMIWNIKKESLPKKRGVYTYYIAETIVGNGVMKERLKRDLLEKLKEKFGEFGK